MQSPQTGEWQLTYSDWNPEQQPLREAICTLGNGYFATRGAAEEVHADGQHYPGTYLAGGYNRLETKIAGRIIENEDLVNWPNWLPLTFRPEAGDWFSLDTVELLDFSQELDIKIGLLSRRIHFRDREGRESVLSIRRLVHMADPHLAAIEWTLIPENWSGRIEVRSALDGNVSNKGVARYRELNNQHLDVLGTERVGEAGVLLAVQTNQSHIRMAQAARTQIFIDGEHASAERKTLEEPGYISQEIYLECQHQRPVRVEKIVSLYTSRDMAISEPVLEARKGISRAGNFQELLKSHKIAWKHLWNRCDMVLEDGQRSEFILRLHIFHLLQTTSKNTIDRDAGVPARGLHGEAYRGHIFWDELFIFPFLNLRIPELTRALLMYRYHRLPEARCAARESGYRGAMFPWQSGSNGREESQVIHLNPKSGNWVPDDTHRQRHVNAAIAYNVWKYYQVTYDLEFLSFYGAEIMLEIARFWAGIAVYNPQRDRYEIHHVVGPDEFHTGYPDSKSHGLNNNAYTNVMAAWVLHCALEVLKLLPQDRRIELEETLDIEEEEFVRWNEIVHKMFIPFHDDGIISQFEGYENLEKFDWDVYHKKYGDIQRLDRILEAEGNSPNRYQAGKQADVLMLFYLFSDEELAEILERMGYRFGHEMIPKNTEYYLHRTSHGSTLSRVVHSWVLARSHREQSWGLFKQALESDIADIQGGTTSEGIHLGAMAGTVDLVQRCYTGVDIREDALWLDPSLPPELKKIHLRIHYRGHWLRLQVSHSQLKVSFERGRSAPARIGFRGKIYEIDQGESKEFVL